MFLIQAQATPIDRTSEGGMYHRSDTIIAAIRSDGGFFAKFWDADGPFFTCVPTGSFHRHLAPWEWR